MALKTTAIIGCAVLAMAASQLPISGLNLRNIDPVVRPQDDLFRAANGEWLATSVIAPDRVTSGTFVELQDKTEADLREIVEGLTSKGGSARGTAAQIAGLYASVMDIERIEAVGLTPIADTLRRIDTIADPGALATEAGTLSALALGGPFPGGVDEDARRPGVPIATFTPGGTLLPDRDYYLSDASQFVTVRNQYVDYLTTIFVIAGRAHARDEARSALAFETELARHQWPPDPTKDVVDIRRFTLEALGREMPGFDWRRWARAQGIDRIDAVVLTRPAFFAAFAKLIAATPFETSRAWLRSRLLTASAPYLTSALSDARFEFFGRVLSGQELPRTHWKRGVSLVNGFLGDAVGRLYVERHFPASAKARVERLVRSLVDAFREAIAESTWLSARARRSAIDKLSRLTIRVGYPNRWRSYQGLVISPDDLFGNVQRARRFDANDKLRRLSDPAARDEWLMTPQSVNAYYSPGLNEIIVPAAMLQPPLFTPAADDAANYGAIGAIVGHEIAHGFDERGRRQNASGAAENWWTSTDEQAFASLADRLVAQFNGYSPLPGARVNGLVTLRENLGDVSGLSIAWRAYKKSLQGKPSQVIDGYTGEQRFFLSWAQAWKGRSRDEYLRQTLASSPHAPAAYRANGPASNLAGFYEAFNVTPRDGMYRPPDQRVTIW